MIFGSLFSGIGGLDLGLEWAGLRCAFQAESDPVRREILAMHWPDVRRLDDVRKVTPSAGLPVVDLLAGGFPCQDLSAAGRKAGLAGERSGLWSEFRRCVAELGPRWVLVENIWHRWRAWVPAVRTDLARLGYASLPIRVRAADVGAPHERARCFLVAAPDLDQIGLRLERRSEDGRGSSAGASRRSADADPEGQSRDASPGLEGGNGAGDGAPNLADAPPIRRTLTGRIDDARGRVVSDRGSWWAAEPGVVRMAHGVPSRMDRIGALGDSVVPQVAEVLGRLILDLEAAR